MGRIVSLWSTLILTALLAAGARAGVVHVAVAANFTAAAEEIAEAFAAETGHEARLSFGSTGALFAQITQGAPFKVLLAADQARPMRLVEEDYAAPERRITYAIGRLALYSRNPDLVDGPETLTEADFTRLAVANPDTAPYGAAAMEALHALGAEDAVADRIVQGASISQTYQFAASGAAELGFVALAQIAAHEDGSRWVVPEDLHAPIAQDAVLLRVGEDAPAAVAFFEFLSTDAARAVIARYGYGLAEAPE